MLRKMRRSSFATATLRPFHAGAKKGLRVGSWLETRKYSEVALV